MNTTVVLRRADIAKVLMDMVPPEPEELEPVASHMALENMLLYAI